MQKFIYGFVAFLLLTGLFFNPFTATSAAAAATCGDTYTVQRGDFLSKIAKNCSVSLSTIVSANPEIKNINVVYPGQIIRLKVDNTIPVTGGGTYTVKAGDYLSLIALRFDTTTAELLKLNPDITNPSVLYVGQVIKLPSGTSSSTSTSAQVSLSSRSVKAGAQVTVYVSGFPKKQSIDLRIGKQYSAYTTAVDAKTDSSGAVTVKVTIPSTAKVGEKWVVKVLTTEMTKGVEATSLTITIVK